MRRPWTFIRMREFFPRLSIASVDGKQYLSEVQFNTLSDFHCTTRVRTTWSNNHCSSTFLALYSDFFLVKNQALVVCQAPKSPDLAFCDFWLFPKLKRPKVGYFTNNENPMRALNSTSFKCFFLQLMMLTGGKKLTHAYKSSRSPHEFVLHWWYDDDDDDDGKEDAGLGGLQKNRTEGDWRGGIYIR